MNKKISADTFVMAAAIGACVLFLAATACFGERNFFTFLCYGFGVLMILLILDMQFRKKSSHILMTMLVLTLVFGYVLALGIFNFVVNKDILTGIVGIIAAALVAASAALYFKKTLDGDCKLSYFVVFIVAALIVYAISVSNYNLLDAFNHQGDVVFWCGYATSRAFLLAFLLITWVNHGSDYEPAGIQVDADI